MYAIVEIAGLQYKVKQDQQLFVNRLNVNEGDSFKVDRVLLTDNGSINVGAPVIEDFLIEAEVLEHLKADKIIVFKKKRRKGYQKKNGHRQMMTKIKITTFGGAKSTSSTETKSSNQEVKPIAESVSEVAAEVKDTAKHVADAVKDVVSNVVSDNLTQIEGIGKKTAEILNSKGYNSFEDLANAKFEDLREILDEKGGMYKSMDPATWAKQARFAADGLFDDLKVWQAELKGGKEQK